MPADTIVLPEPRRKTPPEPAAAPPEHDGLPPPQRLLANITIWLAIVLAVMDSSIANVALPSIARSVHATPSGSIWVVNAYQLSITICLLPLASLGEIVGYAKVYRAGLAVFTLASLACALSDSLGKYCACLRNASDEIDDIGDEPTSDFYNQLIVDAEEQLYFLESHLEAGDVQ